MDLKVGDKVTLMVVRSTALGYTVLIDEMYEGILYRNELYQHIDEGDELEGYIKKIRDDEKIDVSLQPIGFLETYATNEIKILEKLKQSDGFLPLHDKSDPELIKRELGMSKKAFKNAIGGLFKQKVITIAKDGIKLV